MSRRPRCPRDCPCLCHDTGGVGHGSGPCPTKLGQPVPDDWKPA